MSRGECPFEEGDRVDHRKFGFGTVSGAPVATVGPDPKTLTKIVDCGWSIPVTWDDADRSSGRVAHWALTKISSPDTRPFTYWDRQWQPLLGAWLSARRKLEDASKEFRPAPQPQEIHALQKAEADAYAAMQAFIARDQSQQQT